VLGRRFQSQFCSTKRNLVGRLGKVGDRTKRKNKESGRQEWRKSHRVSRFLNVWAMRQVMAIRCAIYCYMMCSSAQLSRTRNPISPGSATGKVAMLSASNFGQRRISGFSLRSFAMCFLDAGRFGFFISITPKLVCPRRISLREERPKEKSSNFS
jgi:hypothetical protein